MTLQVSAGGQKFETVGCNFKLIQITSEYLYQTPTVRWQVSGEYLPQPETGGISPVYWVPELDLVDLSNMYSTYLHEMYRQNSIDHLGNISFLPILFCNVWDRSRLCMDVVGNNSRIVQAPINTLAEAKDFIVQGHTAVKWQRCTGLPGIRT